MSSLTAGAADIKSHGHVIVIIIILGNRDAALQSSRSSQQRSSGILRLGVGMLEVDPEGIHWQEACMLQSKKEQENEQSSGTNKK